MTDHADDAPDDILALLPWYATGALAPGETARVERALAADPALRKTLARIAEERDETVLLNQSLPAPRAGGIDRLMLRIEAEAPRRDRTAQVGLLARLAAAITGLGPRGLAFAAIAGALVILAEGGALINVLTRAPAEPSQYSTASVEPAAPADQAVLLVSFVPGAALDAVTALLRAEHATIIDGPKAGGLFRIAVASGEAERVLADLKARPDLVRFAGPSK
jgi:anti-sigma factor RsiW